MSDRCIPLTQGKFAIVDEWYTKSARVAGSSPVTPPSSLGAAFAALFFCLHSASLEVNNTIFCANRQVSNIIIVRYMKSVVNLKLVEIYSGLLHNTAFFWAIVASKR